jgi:membrane-bound ClpP family serine protease
MENSSEPFNLFIPMLLGGIPILLGIYGLVVGAEQWFSYLLIIGGIWLWWWLAK